jgi:hypothetical protein
MQHSSDQAKAKPKDPCKEYYSQGHNGAITEEPKQNPREQGSQK